MRASKLVAVLAFLLVVPACIWLAYSGHRAGLWSYGSIPIVFGVAFTLVTISLFALLPRLKRWFG